MIDNPALPDDAVTAATENVTAFLLGCGWTVAEAAEVAPHLADNIVAAAAPAIAAQAAATERERIPDAAQRETWHKLGEAYERARIRNVMSPAQFRKLADWFDTDDEFKEAMFPETWSPGSRQNDVQKDLRRVADLLDGAP